MSLLLIGLGVWCSLVLLVVALGRAAQLGDARELERVSFPHGEPAEAVSAAAGAEARIEERERRRLEAA